ncbi:MAG TPA: ribosome biogenesis GTPase Der [Myxococcales bacterium]|jgi:GTP-binding protein|nr:ribosome biogenesis GTPase Der [Myxococcales bacterium]
MLPLVALVGRPNVGKSTLFNRIVGRRLAIVEDVPGVTRDRQYAEAEQGKKRFRVVDTGGFTLHPDEQLVKAVREQAETAIQEADVIVFVVDAVEGLAGAEHELAQILRRGGKPVLLAANKVDSNQREQALELGELHRTGFDVFPVSAEHGRGVDELMDAIAAHMPETAAAEESEQEPIHLAVLGRPNVGKSTLLNRLLGEERFVASAMPGTTRDAVDEELTWKGRRFVLTDTAGLRKKRQVVDKVEVFSAQRALRAVERADVVVVLTDATALGVDQDARIAAQAEERGRAVILCVNKWDLVRDKDREAERLREEAGRHLQHVDFAPLLFVSALDGTRVKRILELAAELHDEASTRIGTPELNTWVQQMQDEHPAPLFRGFPVRFSYAYQVATQPVTVAIQCNRPQAVDEGYRRFLVNRFRDRFGLHVPVRLVFRIKSRSTPRGAGGAGK